MLANLARTPVHGVNLPEDLYDHFWRYHRISDKHAPTLLRLLSLDFKAGLQTLPYVGPLDTSPDKLLRTCLQALAVVVTQDATLHAMVTAAGEADTLALLGKGDAKLFGTHYQRLCTRFGELTSQRTNLERLEEPSLLDHMALEKTERHRRIVDNLRALSYLAHTLHLGGTRWDDIAHAAMFLHSAAHGVWQRRSSQLFVLTPAQRKAHAKALAQAFLTAYQAPVYDWRH